MNGLLTLIALVTLANDPMIVTVHPAGDYTADVAAATCGSCTACGSGCLMSGCGDVCNGCGCGRKRLFWFQSTCDWANQNPIYSVNHGHYYFRPYGWVSLETQRDLAIRLGDEPGNPYGNRIFNELYSSFEKNRKSASPALMPTMSGK